MKKNTIIVNLIGGQGAGKSTTMAGVFAYLKDNGIDCEMSPEFAKELVWEGRHETMTDQLYLFAKQNHRLARLNGKVEVIVTDKPLIMDIVYNRYYCKNNTNTYDEAFETLVKEVWNNYNNVTFVLNRVKKFNPNGRNETEEQAKEFDKFFKDSLVENEVSFEEVDGDSNANIIIGNKILEMLNNNEE